MFWKDPFKKLFWGANRITRVTLDCFFIAFVFAYGEIFLEYFHNILEKVLEISLKFSKKFFILFD
jgi:hypothetical protein